MNSVYKKITKCIEAATYNRAKEHTNASLRIQVRYSLFNSICDKIDNNSKWNICDEVIERLK